MLKKVLAMSLAAMLSLGLASSALAATGTKSETSSKVKYSWENAYKTFYSAKSKLKGVTLSMSGYKIRNNYVYTINMLGDGTAESLNNTAKLLTAGKSAELIKALNPSENLGVMLNDKNDKFYGEGEINFESKTKAKLINQLQFKEGSYANRESLTITATLEEQLVNLGYCPYTLSAHSVIIPGYTKGVLFTDDGKATSFMPSDKGVTEKLTPRKLYKITELGKILSADLKDGKIAVPLV